MIDYLVAIAYVVIFFVIGLVAGSLVMNYYYDKRFAEAATKCMDDDSVAPLLDELNDIA